MSLFTIPEIITYETDDYTISSVSLGVATAVSGDSSTTITVPAGNLTTSSVKVVYNCFTDLTFSDLYHSRRLNNDVWRTADEDTRTSALFWATDILNRQAWLGAPKDYDQALSWPRDFVPNRNSLNQGYRGKRDHLDIENASSLSFTYLEDDTTPKFLQDACAELALYLIKRSNSGKDEMSQYTDQLSTLSVGGISLGFREEDSYITDMPYQVYYMIRDFLGEVRELDPSVKSLQTVSLSRR